MQALTADLPQDPKIILWVGAWRSGVSWNHAEMIAVDGRFLHTGGHNLWGHHYLKHSPVYDLSIQLEGQVAHAAHLFANDHWKFIQEMQTDLIGRIVDILPDTLPLVLKVRQSIVEFPDNDAGEFPPAYKKRFMPKHGAIANSVPMIACGRRGQLFDADKASDDAFIAMIDSARKILRPGLQDIGPVCFSKTKIALPGCTWPHRYLQSLAKVICKRGVDVEIILSNPGSIPGGLIGTEANYGNGWSCCDVAFEIIKEIKKMFLDAGDDDLRKKVSENLRICFLRIPLWRHA
jgi:phosphatidylserine/phosphatidylglycerophosphate/cardiolipin synthase-like enzyme